MTKFAITKKVDLAFLGDKWKENECYLEFTAFTIRDLQDKFPEISIQEKDAKSIRSGMTKTIELLTEHFVTGKGIDDKGEVVTIKGEELVDLPAEVITKIFSFLSEPLAKPEE